MNNNINYLDRVGISNIETIRFNKIHNKFNVFQSQNTTPSTNDGTLSTYVVNGELYFSNNKLTEGGSITGGTGTISDSPFTITNGTITQKTAQPLQLQNQAISSISNITATHATITNIYSTNATITSIAPDTISMTGSTRTISNLDGLNFTGLNPYITGLNNLNLAGNLNATLSTIGTLTSTLATITNLNGSTANITTITGSVGTITNFFTSTLTTSQLNLSQISLTNATITNLYGTNIHLSGPGSKLDGVDDATITDLYTTYISGAYLYGTVGGTDKYIEMPDNNFLKSKQIENHNSGGSAKIFSDEYYIGTPASNRGLNLYIQDQIGTVSNANYTNFFVVPQSFDYLQLDLNKGNTGTLSGLKTDILEVNELGVFGSVYTEQFYCSSDGGNLFSFFDSLGDIMMSAGKAYADYTLAKKMLKIGTGVLLSVAAVTVAGNLIYAIATESSEPSASDYLDMADEYGCEHNGTLSYSILDNPIGAPTNSRTVFTFAFNPGFGRLTSGSYQYTETAQALGAGNDVEFGVYSIINGHDPQRSMSFHQYADETAWNAAKQGVNGAGITRSGNQMWDRRLVAIDTSTISGQFQPRLRFHNIDNQIAYLSDVNAGTLTDYWEVASGNLQPNAHSGLQGKVQINAGAVNLYNDLYLVNSNLIFDSGSKAYIDYDDSAKSLTFKNGDNTGEFKFLDYNSTSQFNIDTANNRIEIPNYDLFFQNSYDQKINKVGSTNLIFEMNSQPIITLKNPPSIWVAGYEYPVATYQDSRLSTSGGVNHTSTQIELKSPNNTGNLFIRCDNGGDGSFTNVFYSRRQGATTGNQYNIFLDVPKTKVNSLIFTETATASLTSLPELEYTVDTGVDYLAFEGNYLLTNNAPNITNKLTFDSVTLTNSGIERNGSDLYWNGSKLNSQSSGSTYFTDDGTLATSSALNFEFVQNVNVTGTLSCSNNFTVLGPVVGGGNNMVFNLGSTGSSYITINHGKRFINYDTTALYISNQSGTDANNNIQFQLFSSPSTMFKIGSLSSTFYNNVELNSGKNLSITSGTLSVTGDISHSTGIITANNISTSNLTVTPGSITAQNIQNTGTFTNFGRIDTNGDVDLNANLIVRSQNISTNYLNVSMNDTTATYALNGGSAPSTHIFKDYNNDVIAQIKRDDFRIYSSAGNTTFWAQSANISMYNPLDVNEIYSRSGTQLDLGVAGTSVMNINGTLSINIPVADLYLQQGNVSTTDDSNGIFLGKWRIKQAIVPNVEFQALRFQFDVATGGKGGYILRSRNDAVISMTIQHKNAVIEEETFTLQSGMLLSSTGIIKNYSQENIVTISETLPLLKPTEKAKDKAVFGIWSGDKKKVNEFIWGSFGTECEPLEEDSSRCLVNSAGEGGILVCNEGGNIEIGDYICSSNRKGLGMKQDDDLNHNYTVAKATTAHIFSDDNQTVLIGCIYLL